MTLERNDGGPAFPSSCTEGGHLPNVPPGMTLRQWYAGMALQGLLSHDGLSPFSQMGFDHMARQMFIFADCMIGAGDAP